jgi:hypothetical protein
MLPDPSWIVGLAVAAAAARRCWPNLFGVIQTLAQGRVEVALERERRATLALILDRLPPGGNVTHRDALGQERIIQTAVMIADPAMLGSRTPMT